jgi:hypothetical protein
MSACVLLQDKCVVQHCNGHNFENQQMHTWPEKPLAGHKNITEKNQHVCFFQQDSLAKKMKVTFCPCSDVP